MIPSPRPSPQAPPKPQATLKPHPGGLRRRARGPQAGPQVNGPAASRAVWIALSPASRLATVASEGSRLTRTSLHQGRLSQTTFEVAQERIMGAFETVTEKHERYKHLKRFNL